MRTPRKTVYLRRAQNFKPGKYRCRCSKCDARVTYAKHPETYRKEPKCGCGGELRIDMYRTTGKESARFTCHCGAAHFPHRSGYCRKLTQGNLI